MPKVFLAHTLRYTEDVLEIADPNPARLQPEENALSYHLDEEEDCVCIADMFELQQQEKLEQERRLARAQAKEAYEAEETGTVAETNLMVREILENAEAEAEQIKERAFQTAMADKERLMLSARQEADTLLQNSKAQGYQQGLSESEALLQTHLDNLEKAIAHLEGDLAGFEVELEEQLRWMALEISSRVLQHKVHEDDSVLTDMVAHSVQGIRNMPWIRIEVAQNMTRLIKKLEDLFAGQEHIEISPIPAQEDTIQIETPSGRLDAGVQTQLDNLRLYFQKNTE